MKIRKQTVITEGNLTAFEEWLKGKEKAAATVDKYRHDAQAFAIWINGEAVSGKNAALYKRRLMETRKAASVNAAIAALNAFFVFMKMDIRLKPLKIQRQTFRPEEKELTKAEYERLLEAAKSKGDTRMNLILQTICSTGIRVSELFRITVEAARTGYAVITNKGKTRTVFLPGQLQTALVNYAKKHGIVSGSIFIGRSGKSIDRRDVWARMKKLCEAANVPPEKAYPHNLRHLFAREFYGKYRDVIRLADVLGHSSVNTTRIYTMESGEEHRRLINGLGLARGFPTEYLFRRKTHNTQIIIGNKLQIVTPKPHLFFSPRRNAVVAALRGRTRRNKYSVGKMSSFNFFHKEMINQWLRKGF
ncbi:MAG: tyrosine-type recombinase/integrase [Acidobacteriota bacterium]|nr:tyrosine-type recombinase/integrase [Acidobacteriota bacterium]